MLSMNTYEESGANQREGDYSSENVNKPKPQ